jgi:hypothetical protein
MTLPPPNNVRGKLHEVDVRYKHARRRRDDPTSLISRKRLRDLGRFFHHRYGALMLPDDDSGREDLMTALDHLVLRPDAALVQRRWVTAWAPWLSDQEYESMVRNAGRTWTATELGTHLGLTDEERAELQITTIAPCGLTEAEWAEIRKSRKRQRDRDTKRRKRAEAKRAGSMSNSRLRVDTIVSLLSPDGIHVGLLFDLVAMFPGFDLPHNSLRRAVNRIINDLADKKVVEITGPRNARVVREVPTSND